MGLSKRIFGDLERHSLQCRGFEFTAKTEDHGASSTDVVSYVCRKCKKPVVRLLKAKKDAC